VPDDSKILRIGEWRVDPDLDELSREGHTIRVEPGPMRLLLYLAAHAGRVVEVQVLLDEVWPNVVVTQGSVYQAIAQLRRFLGDESEHPRYIENLPRRGYRLIAPVAPWDMRCAAATDSSPAGQGLTGVTNGSVTAEQRLASGPVGAATTPMVPDSRTGQTRSSSVATSWWSKVALGAIGAVLAAALAYFATEKFWVSKQLQVASREAPATGKATSSTSVTVEAVDAAFNPPPHSIAVLPFVNISSDKQQEYFSDGLTEELLNSLSRINELQVAARTSSFSFQGEHPDIATVAHKLNVGAVLEGSVRRSANTVRISAQLVNAVTGFHIWSQTYDRDLGDVLKLQSEVATAVAEALKVSLLGDVSAKIELGGTRNPAAFDAYLRATKIYQGGLSNPKDIEAAIAGYTKAIRLDPGYALAYSSRSIAVSIYGVNFATTMSAIHAAIDNARADAHKAINLAPNLSEGHLALAIAYQALLEFPRATEEFERAMAFGPGTARTLRNYGGFAVEMGRSDFGLTLLRRAVVLDPLNVLAYSAVGDALGDSLFHRYPEAIAAYNHAEALDSNTPNSFSASIGWAYYLLGDFESARFSCEKRPEYDGNQLCLAVSYDKLGRHADAEAMLAKVRTSDGDSFPLGYSVVYAQWGKTARALDWLETALRLRDPRLISVKTEPLLDPLRKEPRFQAIERELKFPN